MLRIFSLLVASLVVASGVATAAEGTRVPEVRPFAGAFLPVGDQRNVLKDAALVGGQVALEVQPALHLVGSFAWSPNENRPMLARNTVDLYQYDVGAEGFHTTTLSNDWTFKPFIGLGVGGRTYHLRDVAVKAQTDPVGYGSLGSEFQLSRIALRLEARDYVSRFKGITGGNAAKTRSDVGVTAGFAYHIW